MKDQKGYLEFITIMTSEIALKVLSWNIFKVTLPLQDILSKYENINRWATEILIGSGKNINRLEQKY